MNDSKATEPGCLTPVILRGLEGDFAEALLVFRPGFAVGPFTLGQQGDWRVRAEGVANAHLYLWFDGMVLHAARLHGGPEAWVDGQLLREDWHPLTDASELRVGAAKVVVSMKAEVGSEAAHGQRSAAAPTPVRVAAAVTTGSGRSWSEKLGLRNRTLTRRIVLAACLVPAVVLLWLVWSRTGRLRPKATPVRGASSTEVGVERAAPRPLGSVIGNTAAEIAPAAAQPTEAEPAEGEATEATLASAATTREPELQRLERAAADAVLRGDFQSATARYGELSLLVPSSRAFAVAKRVSSTKAGLRAPGL